MRKRALAGWLAIVLVGLAAGWPGDAGAQGKLRVGQVYVWLGDLPLYVAQEKGFYRAKGIEVDLIAFRGGGEVANALVGGSVDVAIGAVDHAIKMEDKGLDVSVVLVIQDKLGFTMFARKGAGIRNVADLKGKVLSTSAPGSASDNYMRYLLVKHGLDPLKDVTIVAGGGNEGRIAALKQGSAAGGAVTEPATSIILDQGIGEVLHHGTEWDYPFNVAIVKTDFARKNPALVRAFVEATLEGARYARANPGDTEEIAVKLFAKGDPKIIRQATRNYLPTFSQTGLVSDASLGFAMDLLLATKAIKEVVPGSRFVDPGYLPGR
jgi:NitT/TauT family transport system substrate-binding protein